MIVGKKKNNDYGKRRRKMIMGKEEREWLWEKEEENDYGER